jgi:hypothetical protein
MKIVRLNIRFEWTPPYIEHFMMQNDFGHINTPSQNEPLLTLNISWRTMILAILIHLLRMNPITLNIEHIFRNAPLK